MSPPVGIVGQLYQVKTRAEYRSDGSIEKCTFIIHATSQSNALDRLHWAVDQSKYLNFRVVRIEKISHVHRIKSHIIPASALANLPASLRIEEGGDGFSVSGVSQRTNQGTGRGLFGVGIAGKMRAVNVDTVLRVLGSYLLRLGLGDDTNNPNPLIHGGVVQIEQEGEVDSTVTTQSQLRRMDGTHFQDQKPLRGGAPGSGKR